MGAHRIGWMLVSAVVGVGLLLLAVPRTLAAWASYEASSLVEKLQENERPSDEELTAGVAAIKRALDWSVSARRLTDLALLQLEQAVRLPEDDPNRGEFLAASEKNLVVGLAANPANGFAWLRLAAVREQQKVPGRQVVVPLLQSLDVAPNMRRLWIVRAGGLLAYWRFLTPEELASLRSHLRTIWRADKAMRLPLMRTAEGVGQFPILAWSLSEDPAAAEQLKRLQSEMVKPAR